MFRNLKTLFSSRNRIIAYIALVITSITVWRFFTDTAIMFGNYGTLHTSVDIFLSFTISILFPLFLVGFFYKSTKFWKKATFDTKTWGGILGGIIGTVISGASCCGATLAAWFGLLPLMSLLPWSGLEIKIIGVLGLLYALYDLLKNLETCKIAYKK